MSEAAVNLAATLPYESAVAETAFPEQPSIKLVRTRLSGSGTSEKPTREHSLATIELDGYKHAIELTDPVHGEAKYTIHTYPGLTEHIEGDIRQKMHNRLSYLFPDARVVSVASNGIGDTGDRYSWNNRSKHDLDAMGQQRLKIAQTLGADKPAFILGTSMGSVVGHRVAQANLARPVAQRIDLRGLLMLTPALVDPSRTITDMLLRFPVKLSIDVAKELTYKTKRRELLPLLGNIAHQAFRPRDVVALSHQTLDLLRGTPLADIEAVLSEVPSVVVGGDRDSLTQQAMFEELVLAHPDKIRLAIVAGRGHALGMKAVRACNKIEQVGRELFQDELPSPVVLRSIK